MINNPLDQVRSTLVIMILFGVIFFLPLFIYQFLLVFDAATLSAGAAFTFESLVWALSYPVIAWFLWLGTAPRQDELADIVMNIPEPAEIRSYIRLSIILIISSIGFTYLLFYPLSLVAPDMVYSWLLDSPYLLYWDDQGIYLLGNLAGLLLAIVFAPVVEEYLFRGYLLNRWTLRFGPLPAMLLSALIFAILHPDVLGAFVFSIVMSLLYMKTRTLLAPIIVHAANNVFAVLMEWIDRSLFTGFEQVTISDFQDYLWLGMLCMLIGFPWLWLYVKRNFLPIQPLLLAHQQGEKAGNDYLA
ncbi:MAG: type II CAAX endopeptidase family protein [Thiolinea sp.]